MDDTPSLSITNNAKVGRNRTSWTCTKSQAHVFRAPSAEPGQSCSEATRCEGNACVPALGSVPPRSAKPVHCHLSKISGLARCSAHRHSFAKRARTTSCNRSHRVKRTRPLCFRPCNDQLLARHRVLSKKRDQPPLSGLRRTATPLSAERQSPKTMQKKPLGTNAPGKRVGR